MTCSPMGLRTFPASPGNARVDARLDLAGRLGLEEERLGRVSTAECRQRIVGTLGRQVSFRVDAVALEVCAVLSPLRP